MRNDNGINHFSTDLFDRVKKKFEIVLNGYIN